MLSLILALVLFLSIFTTGLLRKYALSRAIIDIPNERSSHTAPTPRGGGAAIACFILLTATYCFFSDLITLNILLALDLGVIIVAITGWVDDHKHIPAFIRAILYGIASALSIYYLDIEFNIFPNSSGLMLKYSLVVMSVIMIVWLINLYNFMDGTDGFSAIQAISTSMMSSLLFYVAGQEAMFIISMVVAVSTSGFLYWNWPPAKIFMGDVGSCVLGFSFGVLAIVGEMTNSISLSVWFVLLSVFICDASFTLILRIVRHEKWYEAHKSHAYQRLISLGVSHKKLAVIFIAINIMLLWPLAWMLHQERMLTLPILIFDIMLMVTIWSKIQLHYYQELKIVNN